MEEQKALSLRGKVYQSIKENILSGKYGSGVELRENTLAEELGVSRTPVREALRQLGLEGLVEIIPNKGAHVVGITDKDVKDIYMIRSYLEGLSARWATKNISNTQLNELEEIILLSEFNLKKSQNDQMVKLDGRFHHILYQASDSRMLEHVMSDFHRYVQHARASSVATKDRAEKSVEEHKAILEAIKEKDEDLAEKLANEHILNVMKNLHKQGYKEY
ncbi:MAG: GntR family transcriptional regulator [Clostridia bacterium]|nr:GntR family transcriptional regulator [Clostridia bacterium]NCC43358.1 GntR family transcriptional regulator [Clostridia bacterium]